MAQARSFFERALALDPGNIWALVGTAFVDFVSVGFFLLTTGRHVPHRFEAALTKVLSLAPNNAVAQYLLGAIYIQTNRAAGGIAKCERALVLDRNLAGAHCQIGVAKYFTGPGRGNRKLCPRSAAPSSPRDTYAYVWMTIVGSRKARSRPRRGSHRLVAPVYRCESK